MGRPEQSSILPVPRFPFQRASFCIHLRSNAFHEHHSCAG